ncbi:MAG: Holliday junction branch migration protein RuvA [Tissierellia bacterium]|nr:Holliday junction branch migration protein RuvA [Tissierellia bacterium]
MISYIIGDIKAIEEEYIILENNGLGYQLRCSQNTMADLNLHDQVMIYTEMIVREDEISLYGFDSMAEKDLFLLLTSVTSIGPKNGMRILSALRIDEIKYAIHNDDIKLLTKAPGVGKKTASRIILELKDKIDDDYTMELKIEEKESSSEEKDFAIDALVNLGYNRGDVMNFVRSLDDDLTLEEIVKIAMKSLENRGA